MDDRLYGQMAAEQVGYFKSAARARAERINNNTLTLRDRARNLADCYGTYLVGSLSLGRYKIGYAASPRNGIGSHDAYPAKGDLIMWREACEVFEGKKLADQLRNIFQTKCCEVPDTPGKWFSLNDQDVETLKTKFSFVGESDWKSQNQLSKAKAAR